MAGKILIIDDDRDITQIIRILLEGDPTSPVDLPGGCRFCGRGPYVKPLCREKLPSLKEITPGHFLACHREDI